MSQKMFKVLDGSQLSNANASIPEDLTGGMNAEQFFELGNARVSERHYGFALPAEVTSGFEDIDNFEELLQQDPQRLLQHYFDFISSKLKADPIIVAIVDGSTIVTYLEDEEGYTASTEELFSYLDKIEEGVTTKSEVRTALFNLGFRIGVPSFLGLRVESGIGLQAVFDMLEKYEVDGSEEPLDQTQFAQLFKTILQDIADELALNPVTVLGENVQIATGPGELPEDELVINLLGMALYQDTSNSEEEESFAQVTKNFFKDPPTSYGFPRYNAKDEVVVRLYENVLSRDEFQRKAIDLNENEVRELGKKLLETFAQEMEGHYYFDIY